MRSKTFHPRSFISFSMLLVILWLLVSGTVLYVSPPGRIAHWQNWTLLGLNKTQWENQHTVFSYTFILLAIWHIFYLNWHNLRSYIKLKTRAGFRKKREFTGAIIIFLVLYVGTSYQVSPIGDFIALGNKVGFGWENSQESAPMPHTENLSLSEIANKQLNMPMAEAVEILKKQGLQISDTTQNLKEIASFNNTSPSKIYSSLSTKHNQTAPAGKGYGRMTLKSLAAQWNMETVELIDLLKENNVVAQPSQTLREVADQHGLHPSALVKMIKPENM